jgi:outer membrane protein TolC
MQKSILLIAGVILAINTFAQTMEDNKSSTAHREYPYPELSNANLQFNSFQEVMAYADVHAIAIQSAAMGEQLVLAEKKTTRSYLLPNASASLGYNDNIMLQPVLIPAQALNPAAPDGTFEELTFGTRYNYTVGLQAQWDILNFQRIFALETANLEVDQSKVNTELNRYDTYNLLANTYYSILLTQESIKIYKENLEAAKAIFEAAETKYDEGLVSEAEMNLSKIKKLQCQKSLDLAEENLKQFYIQLQTQLNTTGQIKINDGAEKFKLENKNIHSRHPEVILQQKEVEKYESFIKQQKAVRLPSISLVYQNNHNWATNGFYDFSNAYELPQQYFGVKVNLPLFTGPTRNKINKSKKELQIHQLQLENTKLVRQKEDEILQLQLSQTSNQLESDKRILALYEQNDIHAENKYQKGLMSLDQRLDKYDELLAAQDNYLKSLAEFMRPF